MPEPYDELFYRAQSRFGSGSGASLTVKQEIWVNGRFWRIVLKKSSRRKLRRRLQSD